MRRFVTAFYRSLYDVNWLKIQRYASASAWSYFAFFIIFATLIGFVPVAVEMPTLVREVKKTFVANVPDFTATIKAGKLNVASARQPLSYRDATTNIFFYVDTVSTSSLVAKDFATGTVDAVVLLTANDVQMYNVESDVVQTVTFDKIGDGAITKTQITEKMDQLLKPQSMVLIGGLFLIIFFVFLFVDKLYIIFLVSAFVMLVGKMRGLTWKFREYFTIGLYAITLPTIVNFVVSLFGFGVEYIQFIAMLAFMIALVWSQEEVIVLKK